MSTWLDLGTKSLLNKHNHLENLNNWLFRVLSGIQWSPTELLWVVRGMQQRPTNLSIVMTQVGVISVIPRLPLCRAGGSLGMRLQVHY